MSPPWPFLKLNTDGAHKAEDLSGGGGVIRDHKGNVLLAFSHFYGQANSLIAEARALNDGIRYLHTISNHAAYIEGSPSTVVNDSSKKNN